MALSKDTLFYSLSTWGRRLIGLVTAPVLIAYLTPDDYGYISLVNTLASFCSILGLLAIVDQGLPRFFIDSKDELEKKGFVTSSFFISGVGVLLMVLIILGSTPLVPLFIKDINVPLVFTSLIALICMSQSFQYIGSNMLKWTFQSPLFTKITIVQTVIGAGLTLGGVIFLGWRAKGVLLAGAVVALGAGAWANLSVKEYVRPSLISPKKLKELVAYSWPLLGINVFAFFTRSLDRIFLASMASMAAVGIFSVSYTIATLFETLVGGFFFAWGPYVLSTFREAWAPKRYAQFFTIFSCLGVISIIVLGLWASPVVTLLRRDEAYREIGVFVPWILSGMLLYYLGGYFAPGPSIKKKTHWKLIAFILAAITNTVFNYTLIPRIGILGAGIATTISSLVAGSFNQVVSNRMYFVPNRWKFSFLVILLFTICISTLQHRSFAYCIMGISIPRRIFLTIGLVIVGGLPFYKDIQASGLIKEVTAKIINKYSGTIFGTRG